MRRKYHVKLGAALAVFLVAIRLLSAAEPSDFAPKPPPCPLVITMSLSAGSATPAMGRDVSFRLEIDNRDGRSIRVFNPFLSWMHFLPLELRIYDSNGKHITTLGDQTRRGSMVLPGEGSYVELPPTGGVSVDWPWHCGAIYTPFQGGDGKQHETLPPGKYFIQAVAYKALTTFDKITPKNFTAEDAKHIWDGFDRSELCKSNMLPVVLAETK